MISNSVVKKEKGVERIIVIKNFPNEKSLFW